MNKLINSSRPSSSAAFPEGERKNKENTEEKANHS